MARRIMLAIGDEDMEVKCPPEANSYITFTAAKQYADAIYTMVRAFKNK
ncbi:hypothetical protein HT576_08980 [Haloterrigena sp. SYSU A121-1]|uniref:Uncharacterized protein n=1 Tax=Haloterrigena gelatinilytica TaxID=2741724 RepID=A0A8J8KHH4_9EURY|nr:hypothetical protein [Haloterrigena gelatinilytica]NUB91154.1 hypothetical protein [Haloterrigena gelatinilytica]